MKITLRIIHWLAIGLVVIGALNWGMIGFFKIDLLTLLLKPLVARILFAIVGIAGIWCISMFKNLASCEILDKKLKK